MRVCLVTGSFPSMDCGVGDYSWQLARHLASSVSVTVVTSDRPVIREFLQTPDAGVAGPGTELDVRAAVRDWSARSLPAIRRAVLEARPDIVHIQYATSAFDLGAGVNWLAGSLKRGGARVPVLTTIHEPAGPWLFPRAGRLRALPVRRLCRDSALICCPDRLVRDWVAANNMGERVRQVPVGVNVLPSVGDAAATEVSRAAPDVGPAVGALRRDHPRVFAGGPVLVTFGNLHPDRDYESVFAALQLLASRHPDGEPDGGRAQGWSGAQWVLVGGGGRGADSRRAEELRELAHSLGLGERVHFAGYCPPEVVSAWLAAADLCVLPLPQGVTDARSSLLTALAHGKATVVVGRGVYSEYLRDGEHLRWAPAGEPALLARILHDLLAEHAARARMERAAVEVIDRHYRWSRIAAETVSMYRELTELGVRC